MFRRTVAAIVLAAAASITVPTAFAAAAPLSATGNSIRIVKIHYRQTGTNLNTEYIVFKNVTRHTINIHDWTIVSSPATDNQSYTFRKTYVGAGRSLTLYTGSGTNSRGKRYWRASGPRWNNDGDTAVLHNGSGTVRDRCTYAGGGTTAYC
jgi:lamin tail-like protein